MVVKKLWNYIINKGADANAKDNLFGLTALMIASYDGHKEVGLLNYY